MNSITSFKQAAKDFQQDDIYIRYMQAKKDNDEDIQLQKDIADFNQMRLELNEEMDKENRNEDQVAQLNTKINALYNDVMGNPHMAAYSAAKEEVEGFINYVNEVLNAALTGQDPLSVDPPSASECGPDCASCAGC